MRLGTTRRRLMLAFGGSFAGLLLLGAAALYLVLVRGYREAYDHHLTESRQLALDLFQFDRGEYPTAAATVAHIMTEMATVDRSVAAFETGGQRIGVARRAPMAPDLTHVSPLGLGTVPTTRRMQGHEVRLLLIPLPEEIELVVGVSDSEYLARVHTLRVALGVGVPILLVLGALLGARLAEPVLRLQRRFLADVAHELRTPIAIVLAEADAGRAADSSARGRAALEAVAREAERMGGMVSDLMLLAREDEMMPPEQAPLYLDDVAQHAIHRVATLPEAAGRPIRLGTWDESRVRGDAALLERAIVALLHNALVHADGGEVTVETGQGDSEAWVRVADTGPGIPRDARERIFERGVRLDRSRPGNGLGLPIVRLIVERHGGTVSIDDTPSGASFTIRLPAISRSDGNGESSR